jgi:hypothetical protein
MEKLSHSSLASMRTIKNRWRAGVTSDAIVIYQKYRAIIFPYLMILRHDHVAIVQHEPISIKPRR